MARILRVGVFNNFNFSDEEFKELKQYEDEWLIFVNSNAKVKLKGPHPIVVTVNPDLTEFVKPEGDLDCIKAVRIKYVSGANMAVRKVFRACVSWCKMYNFPILITYMRFVNKKLLEQFTTDQSNYLWSSNYYRQQKLNKWSDPLFFYCDEKKEGCPSCKNCAKLPFGLDTDEIYSIDLEASGDCPFDCPSCYARKIQAFRPNLRKGIIIQNKKQTGMKHK